VTKCRKCGCTRINGPVYIRGYALPYFCTKEALRFACGRCGYEEDHPTNDSKALQYADSIAAILTDEGKGER
jgi:hypothetical protein